MGESFFDYFERERDREREREREQRREVEMRTRGCKKFSQGEKSFYSHIDSTKFMIFEKMDASCLNKMDLPKAKFKGQIAKKVKLKGPNGNIWQVGITELVEKLRFQSGWKDFVIANSIKANDLLAFKCNSDSFFEVKIFHPSRCEGSSPFFVKGKKTDIPKTNKASDNSIKNLDAPDCEIQQDETDMGTSSSSSDSEYSADYVPIQKTRRRTRKLAGASKEPFVLPAGLQLPPADRKRAMQLSHGVEPGNKYFVTLMKFSHVNKKYLVGIPSKFAVEHLSRENSAVLHYKECEWPLSIYYKYNSDLYPYLSTGFKEFVNDNNLQVGDLCLFELMKNKDTMSFKVHISRCNSGSSFEVQILDPSRCQRSSSLFVKEVKIDMQETSDSSMQVLDGPDCKIQQADETFFITSSSSGDSESDDVPIKKLRGWASEEAGTSKDPNGRGEFESSNDEPIVLPARLLLTPAQKRRAVQLSYGVEPGNKYFVILLKYSHVHGKYAIPTKFATEHLSRGNKNAIFHYEGRKWHLSIIYSRGLCPYFSSEWKIFVKDNNLQIGDICLFELMKTENIISFKVHISRN
ncbi:B3 domain-containing protein [Rhynchospora pubera]|uniref:B3 domain-containing protein n=1 Tax=Rhynchospora pubera TaxID=906938 RepID=A0AAV8FTX8_9POAL|nr:B3 domain-containing protein [Rhynchospora pubera]